MFTNQVTALLDTTRLARLSLPLAASCGYGFGILVSVAYSRVFSGFFMRNALARHYDRLGKGAATLTGHRTGIPTLFSLSPTLGIVSDGFIPFLPTVSK